jgi:hypothetical protein
VETAWREAFPSQSTVVFDERFDDAVARALRVVARRDHS